MYSLSLLLQCHLALLVFLVFIGRVPPLKMPIMTSFGYVLGQSHSFSHPFPIIFGCPCETTVCHQVVSHPVLLAYVAHDLVASVLTYTADAHSIYVSQCLSSSCHLAINNVYGCNYFFHRVKILPTAHSIPQTFSQCFTRFARPPTPIPSHCTLLFCPPPAVT